MINRATIEVAVQRMLYPLISFLIDYGVTEGHFSRLVRRMFVKVGAEKIRKEQGSDTKVTASHIAVMTGVPRKDVKALLHEYPDGVEDDQWYRNRCALVLRDWWGTPAYLDNKGVPIRIPVKGKGKTFESLAHLSGTDIYYRSILEELISVGAVVQDDDEMLEVKEKFFQRSGVNEKTLQQIADTYYDLGSAITAYLLGGDKQVKIKGTFTLDADPEKAKVTLGQLRAHGDAMLSYAEDSMKINEVDESDKTGPRMRVGIGYYVYKG
ncbi:MAG: DUF6502 family protein, partial [Woeseiaceae bacterium]